MDLTGSQVITEYPQPYISFFCCRTVIIIYPLVARVLPRKRIWKLGKGGHSNLSFQSPLTSISLYGTNFIFCDTRRWLLQMAVSPLFVGQLRPVLQLLIQLLTSKNWLVKLTIDSGSMDFNIDWHHKQAW